MVQPAQNRRRDHLCLFGEAMAGGHELVRFWQRIGNPRSEAGTRTASVVVGDPFAQDRSDMSLVHGN
jgi:hypothetical protein